MRPCTPQHGLKILALFVYAVLVFNLGLSYHSSGSHNHQDDQSDLVLRRRLDEVSNDAQQQTQHLQREDDLDLNLSQPLDSIARDPKVLANARKIIHLAHVLEGQGKGQGSNIDQRQGSNQGQGQQYRKPQPTIIPPNMTVEFDPDKGDIVYPGAVLQDLDFKHSWERRKLPDDVTLDTKLEETIENIIKRYADAQDDMKKTRTEKPMNVYKKHSEPFEKWHNSITQFHLYPADGSSVVDDVIADLRTQPFEDMYEHTGGTQLKLVFTLKNGAMAMFKPMKFPRNVEALPDHFVFSDYERHVAEIAAFHLDRVLDFRAVPPTTGRLVNVTEIKELAPHDLRKTFFVSPAGNRCLTGSCSYYCDTGHAVCGRPELLEGSLMAYLPNTKIVHRQSFTHPWKRSYSKTRPKAVWEDDAGYCEKVMKNPPYNSGRRMADLMDLAVFDFLQGNIDRHNYQIFAQYGNFTFNLHYDNGRGFGKSYYDDMLCLAPISQCCLFRYSTLVKLWKLYQGPQHLSDLMRDSMATDPVAPVLLERHLRALDRRVKIILKTVYECVEQKGADKVMIMDGF